MTVALIVLGIVWALVAAVGAVALGQLIRNRDAYDWQPDLSLPDPIENTQPIPVIRDVA